MEEYSFNQPSSKPAKSSGSGNRGLWILIGLLTVLLLGVGITAYMKYKDLKAIESQLIADKEGLINDLNELKVEYDNIQKENTGLKSEVEEAKTKIDQLIAELEKVKKADARLIRKYKNQIYALRRQRDKLLKVVDSLKQANQLLAMQKDSLGQELQQVNEMNQQMMEENKALSETVNKAKTLSAAGMKADGVRIKKNGRIVETTRASRADQIRVCTTLPANPVLEPGPQTIYVQVVNPKGEVIGSKDVIEVDGQEQIISGSKEFHYDGENVDICIYIVPENKKEEFVKGEYMVTFFHNGQKAGVYNFTLK